MPTLNVRIRYDMRRLWRCPNCGYERRLHADQTSIRCHCDDATFMKLVEEQRYLRPPAEELDLVIPYEEDSASDQSASDKSASAKNSEKAAVPEETTSDGQVTEHGESDGNQKQAPVVDDQTAYDAKLAKNDRPVEDGATSSDDENR